MFTRSFIREVPSFQDRSEAGKLLASRLTRYGGRRDVCILALPRGGVPVGFEIALALRLPLDVFVVRKLGVPGYEELAMGAVASGGVRLLQSDVVAAFNIPPSIIEASTQRELQEIKRREKLYRGSRPAPVVKDQIVILADDGLATGSTMRVAAAALKQQKPAYTIVAVPVASLERCEELEAEVDEIICAETPRQFSAVGHFFKDFSEVTDEIVRELLARLAR